MKINSYSSTGKKLETAVFPKALEGSNNLPLLAQALRVYLWREHPGLSKTKTRGEVSLTTKKWFKQKGTGNARHGAKSAPIFVGGGTAHGPKGIKRTLSLSKNMKQKALKTALTLKAKENEIVFVSGIEKWKKTKEAGEFLKKVSQGKKVLFALSEKNTGAFRFIRNVKNVQIKQFADLNAKDVFLSGILVVDKEAVKKEKK